MLIPTGELPGRARGGHAAFRHGNFLQGGREEGTHFLTETLGGAPLCSPTNSHSSYVFGVALAIPACSFPRCGYQVRLPGAAIRTTPCTQGKTRETG